MELARAMQNAEGQPNRAIGGVREGIAAKAEVTA
jgi:hypothetical protein